MDVKYKKYTPEELGVLVHRQLKAEEERTVSASGDPVYDKLFAGLDFTLLSLMCTQVQWSLKECGADPFMKAMRLYVDKIVALVPAWEKLSADIAAQGAFFVCKCQEASLAAAQKDTGTIRAVFKEVKNRLKDFDRISGDMAKATARQSDLANFIIAELTPAVADKKRWTEFGLETCLSNDVFIGGTEASLYNAKTLFSFVSFNASQSIGIIDAEDAESSDSVMFILGGQAGVWECTVGIANRLLRGINEFFYIPYPETKQ